MDTFKEELVQMVTELVNEVKTAGYKVISVAPETPPEPEKPAKTAKPKAPKTPATPTDITALSCPKCKTHALKKGNTAYGCANYQVCGFKLPFEAFGKKLTDKQLAELITKGKTPKLKGLQVPGNTEPVQARLVLNAQFELTTAP